MNTLPRVVFVAGLMGMLALSGKNSLPELTSVYRAINPETVEERASRIRKERELAKLEEEAAIRKERELAKLEEEAAKAVYLKFMNREKPALNSPQLVKDLYAASFAMPQDIVIIGDVFFVDKMNKALSGLELGKAQVFDVPMAQFDIYALMQIYPTIIKTNAKFVIVESIPAYWAGRPYFAKPQPPIEYAQVAIGDIPPATLSEATADAPLSMVRDYIPNDVEALNIEELRRLTFDNWYSYFDVLESKLIWVTNSDLLSETPQAFQEAYRDTLVDIEQPIHRIGRIVDMDNALNLINKGN